MTVEDQARAERKLSQVGYYRLSGFWYPSRQIHLDATTGKAHRCPQTGSSDPLTAFVSYRVSTKVNNTRNDFPELLEPLKA